MDAATRLLAACRGEAVDRPPVWLMRQAGRYLPEYRALRGTRAFLEVCADVDAAVEISLQPLRLVGSEAVVFFSDIFVPVVGMGVGLEFNPGPKPAAPLRRPADIEAMRRDDPRETVPFVFEILRRLRRELEPQKIPLIGFAGAPYTLAAYLVQGGGDPTRRYPRLAQMLREDPVSFGMLMERLAEMTIAYLDAQVEAGAQVLQLFDTWAGALDQADYRAHVLPVNRAIVEAQGRRAPMILYVNEAGPLLDAMLDVGADVISVGASVDLSQAAKRAGARASIQGNLAPEELAEPRAHIFARVQELARAGRAARGHILNLGHGCLPETPVAGVRAFTDAVRALAAA